GLRAARRLLQNLSEVALSAITCVRVGYGVAARIHELKLRASGVSTAAVVEVDPRRRRHAASDGLLAFSSCRQAARLKPTFWDICTSTSRHVDAIESILHVEPAANLLIEKPVCAPSDVPRLLALLACSRGRVVINDNYRSSAVTRAVKRLVHEKLGLRIRRVIVEMTQNRMEDFMSGRFIDQDYKALGYEGPHMLAIVQELGDSVWPPAQFERARLTDLQMHVDGRPVRLPGQRSALVSYLSRTGVAVELYTGLDGVVRDPRPPLAPPHARLRGGTRYRVVIVAGPDREGHSCEVVGFYEPSSTMGRGVGAAVVLRDGVVVGMLSIADDTMQTHLARAVDHFTGTAQNPSEALPAIEIAQMLGRFASASM